MATNRAVKKAASSTLREVFELSPYAHCTEAEDLLEISVRAEQVARWLKMLNYGAWANIMAARKKEIG